MTTIRTGSRGASIARMRPLSLLLLLAAAPASALEVVEWQLPRRAPLQITISPDGATIAFQTERRTTNEYTTKIWTVAAGGGQAVELTNLGDGLNRWPRWSPDGGYMAFESQRGGLWQVYVLDIERQEVKKISDGSRNDRWPNW